MSTFPIRPLYCRYAPALPLPAFSSAYSSKINTLPGCNSGFSLISSRICSKTPCPVHGEFDMKCCNACPSLFSRLFAIPAKFRSLSIVIWPCRYANACSLVSRVLLLNRCRNRCQCSRNFGPRPLIFSTGTPHRWGSNRLFSPCSFAQFYHNLG